jgi:hypothetical protein
MLLKDDLDYWRKRTESEIAAKIKSAAQAATVRAYRWRIIDLKQCPVAARVGEIALSKQLILIMAGGLLAIIPTPGLPGSKTVKQVGSIVGWLAKQIKDWVEKSPAT